ncbi:B3 domain-containing protein Os06g0194400 isoform X1 [Zea mays]|uniref:ABI3VP1 transcription factor n=3 Tax=Zea mays TaxID=4577 RepID=B4FK06_MAIZE|eukprot:NP_001136712.1 uncharacterized protein LOC100216848 [Zea mays]
MISHTAAITIYTKTGERREMAEATPYEEQRRRQVEANKRKLEELQLHHLSAAIREAAAAAKPSLVKKRKARVPLDVADAVMEPVRRSGRLANLPDKPVYREKVPDFGMKIRRTYGSVRRDLTNRVYATDDARSYAISKAEDLEQELDSSFPIFIKPMTQSHVTGGFWLGLPIHFCRKYLPKRDEMITLVDEDDDESDTLYLAMKRGLSAGWRGFAVQQKLVDGDCLVFQLIEQTKFKVYITRASSYYESED